MLHVWVRGFAGNPRQTQVFLHGARFVLSWLKHYQLPDEHGQLRQPGETARVNVPGSIVGSGMRANPVNVRWVSLLFPLQNLPISNHSGWSSFGVGRLKWRSVSTSMNSLLKALVSSRGNPNNNSYESLVWLTICALFPLDFSSLLLSFMRFGVSHVIYPFVCGNLQAFARTCKWVVQAGMLRGG